MEQDNVKVAFPPFKILKRTSNELSAAEEKLKALRECEVRCEILMKSGLESADHLFQESLDVSQLVELDRALQYFKWAQALQELSVRVKSLSEESETMSGDGKIPSSVLNAESLVQCHSLLVNLVSELLDSKCRNLRSYALSILVFTRQRCLNTWREQFSTYLGLLNFPQCILKNTENSACEAGSGNNEFSSLYSCMLRVMIDNPEILQRLPDDLRNVHPVRIMLKPLKQRFKYHFMGSKRTNNPLKPEWYLQQVATWMRKSRWFFDVFVTSAAKNARKQDGHVKFCHGLLEIVGNKLRSDLPLLIDDDVHLSHMIDEVLLFSKELPAQLFCDGESSETTMMPLNVILCDDETQVFNRWIELERKYAFEKIDEMMLKESSWSSCEREGYAHVSKCVESFIALLQSITNRYRLIQDVNMQLEFAMLQCELLEDMRLRFAQILRQEQAFPMSIKFCLIMGSSQYLIHILNSWSGLPLFLQLQVCKFKSKLPSESVRQDFLDDKTVFSKVICEFEFLVSDLVQTLADHISFETEARSNVYRKEIRWFSYNLANEERIDPSPECYGMFQVLSSSLDHISKILNVKLTNLVTCKICDRLEDFFIRDIILENYFSPDGCRQINVDIRQGLRAIFDQYNQRLDHKKSKIYHQLEQVSQLLLLKRSNAILLLASLEDEKRKDHLPHILEEFHIDALTPQQALKILKRRVDLQ